MQFRKNNAEVKTTYSMHKCIFFIDIAPSIYIVDNGYCNIRMRINTHNIYWNCINAKGEVKYNNKAISFCEKDLQ